MKKNQGAIVLAERAADYGRLRSVLRGWGYGESEIQRFLKEQTARNTTDDHSRKIAQSVSQRDPLGARPT